MPQRFESYIFSPGANKLMQEAFEAAWLKATLIDGDRELMRLMLASAIIDQVVAGAQDRDHIAAAALATLAVAKNDSSRTRFDSLSARCSTVRDHDFGRLPSPRGAGGAGGAAC
jgi:hypothetical protein